ncbi:MAG TPA: hypothetical protein VHP11_07665, partial [Tepidisphaeraceae bacterium]|nr:hypothetical protein [Tepidisphaeraceae bacterium]
HGSHGHDLQPALLRFQRHFDACGIESAMRVNQHHVAGADVATSGAALNVTTEIPAGSVRVYRVDY